MLPRFIQVMLMVLASWAAASPAQASDPPARAYGIEFFAGTWCYSDGVTAHYAVLGPSLLQLTRLSPDRRARWGPGHAIPVRPLGTNRFQWGDGVSTEINIVAIKSADTFSYAIQRRWYDRATRSWREHSATTLARRCGAEISQSVRDAGVVDARSPA